MARQLPPLNAVRVFEAAARHLSFTRAAQELNVTQAAVSHQIKSLEGHLGFRLFRRTGRALMLTDEGQVLFPGVRDSLDGLQAAFRLVLDEDGAGSSGVLTVTTVPSFATRWLVPRLKQFRAEQPDIDVRLSASMDLTDLMMEGVDVGVRYGLGSWPGLQAWWLMEEDVFPVCAPSLLSEGPPLTKPEDLANHTLLQDAGMDWRIWLDVAGITLEHPDRGPGFFDSTHAIHAALDGQGVWLGRSVLVRDELEAGRLVKPFDISIPGAYAYWIVCPKADVNRRKVRLFRDWLLSEARAMDRSEKKT
ncbi:MAG: transcriptional regulator GcvA [Sphingomonadales bacterium]|nr:transcriptional regulator GcvA [Sphingomonadales bacterium]